MNQLIKTGFLIAFFITLFSCEKDELEPIDRDEISTENYGLFTLNVYSKNPFASKKVKPIYKENICWNDEYPVQIGSTGTGNCGLGYENITNHFLITEIALVEYDLTKPDYSSFIRHFEIGLTADCTAHSTQESFFNLFENVKYNFAVKQEDYGKFIVKFIIRDKVYSSLNVNNSNFKVDITFIEKIEPINSVEPVENYWNPASVNATLKFSCLLGSFDGEYVLIENAEIRGRFFRQSPTGYNWDN